MNKSELLIGSSITLENLIIVDFFVFNFLMINLEKLQELNIS
jgi:hypothetical protein